jgi:hypothetical protein
MHGEVIIWTGRYVPLSGGLRRAPVRRLGDAYPRSWTAPRARAGAMLESQNRSVADESWEFRVKQARDLRALCFAVVRQFCR